MNTQHHSTSRGFSLIELLIVCAVIGLIAAIAIPNLVNAIQRARQARTVGDIRAISNSVAMYHQDYADFPISTSWAEIATVEEALNAYMENIPANDGWQRAFMYISDGDTYTVASYGLNGQFDTPWTIGPIGFFDDDIVVNDGIFVQWPQGIQQ